MTDVLAIDRALSKLGYPGFRPGQREAIEMLLSGRRLLLVAPTGGGKSLIYQLPAVLLRGVTVVVSPLVALMQDQVEALTQRGVSATFLAAVLSPEEMRTRLSKLAAGDYKLVYVAPERLTYPGFRSLVSRLDVELVAVDEAHCISEWGHDFRPEYGQIGEFLRELPAARVLACTATATPYVRDEILAKLGLPAETPQLIRGFARPNLVFGVREISGPKERAGSVDDALAQALGSPQLGKGAAIVYAPTRKLAEEEHLRLAARGWRVGVYHAGLPSDERERALHGFRGGALEVVVATNAFGMGIDRGDVRLVVHLAPPSSIEAYYQEVGRAGRDQERAYGLLLVSMQDLALRRRLLTAAVDGREVTSEVSEHKWGLFLELIRWADTPACRHDGLLRYFGDESEALGGCGICDICTLGEEDEACSAQEAALTYRKVLSGVARVHGRFGLQAAVKLLSGRADERLRQARLDQVATFGILRDVAEPRLTRMLRRCITQGYVSFTGDQHPLVHLTESGMQAMRGETAIALRLPGEAKRAPAPGRSRAPRERVELDSATSGLFEELRGLRLRLAREQGVPPYVVASDRTLQEMATVRPRHTAQLREIYGMGEARIQRYGDAWLDLILRHIRVVGDRAVRTE